MTDSRAYPPRPILAVSALILDARGRVLIVRRSKDPSLGLWSLPGGAVMLGETVAHALLREVLEECGIRVEIGSLFGVHDRMLRDAQGAISHHYVILNYRCRPRDDQAPRPGSDVDAALWLAPEDQHRYTFTDGVQAELRRCWRDDADER